MSRVAVSPEVDVLYPYLKPSMLCEGKTHYAWVMKATPSSLFFERLLGIQRAPKEISTINLLSLSPYVLAHER